jgi:hypothetical protein
MFIKPNAIRKYRIFNPACRTNVMAEEISCYDFIALTMLEAEMFLCKFLTFDELNLKFESWCTHSKIMHDATRAAIPWYYIDKNHLRLYNQFRLTDYGHDMMVRLVNAGAFDVV